MARKQQIEDAAHQRNMYVGGKGNISTALIKEFIAGAEWADKTMIDKAVKWLKSYRRETFDGLGYIAGIIDDTSIEDFRKAMEE